MLAFWFFTTGLTANATALLALQLSYSEWERPPPRMEINAAGGTSGGAGGSGGSHALGNGSIPVEGVNALFARPEGPNACSAWCTGLASATLLTILAVLFTGLAMLLRFSKHYRASTWTKVAPEAWNKVNDPIFRLWSRLRLCATRAVCCAPCGQRLATPVDRFTGKWVRPSLDVAEPARTERLLARPFTVFHGCAADIQDSMALHLLNKASGRRFLGLGFSWFSMLVQIVTGVLSGLGPFLAARGLPAALQVSPIDVLCTTL